MDKQSIIDFFNRMAPQWDSNNVRDEEKITAILDYAGIKKNVSVLDVACGTGVLIPDYLARNVKKITAVDISPLMIDIAQTKFSDPRIKFLNDDIEAVDISESFDTCVVYNAFPHFLNPGGLIQALADKLILGGRLTIAHSMSREALNAYHSSAASAVSIKLMSESELSILFDSYFTVDTAVSNEAMYVVSGVKRIVDNLSPVP
ncbi:MAG: class I SAM-dependent methyltransferase [Treponema sp.]|nr:class I SAM-dependent methyltransferase [Treponema sp.]